jgi:hypothetical protein
LYCSRLTLNPEEYVCDSTQRKAMKQSTVNALWLRGKYRIIHNPIAAGIIGLQILLTVYATVCSIKSTSLDNRTKGFTGAASVYVIMGQLHELSNMKYYFLQDVVLSKL